jgi:hypothetical protein
MFHLVMVVVDPFTNESAWILRTGNRILSCYEQADCRVAWLVTGTPEECRLFLGPYADEIMTFSDADRSAVKAFGLTSLPALVHVGAEGQIVGVAEGWDPPAWRAVTHNLSRIMSWSRPVVPTADDPAPYSGSPAV